MVAQGFINAYVAEVSKPEVTQKKAVAWVKRNPAATDSFKKKLEEIYREGFRKDPEMGYGADAVLGAQDFPERFTVFSEEKKNGVATVVLVGDKTCPMKVEVRLVERAGAWLVDASGDLIAGGER